MITEAQSSQNPKSRNGLLATVALIVCVTGNAATTNEQVFEKHRLELLLYYAQKYPEDIFNYCVGKHTSRGSRLGTCMRENEKLKQGILKHASKQLGSQSLAQEIYDECREYYPKSGVARINDCVKTRLVLDGKLEDDTVEKEIYQKCDLKWRKHGSSAIDNCSRMEANYYRDKGKLRN